MQEEGALTKQGEMDYLRNIGEAGAEHAANKPFSDAECGVYLVQIGTVMSLLPPPPARLLDLGCGTGWTSRFLARHGYEVTGVDISADMIACAERKSREEKVTNLCFLVQDFESLGFAEEFDCALFFSALHHTEDEEAALRGVYRALKPGGVCLVSEPGKGHAAAPASRDAVEKYGVTERDMPPSLVVVAGRRAGFGTFHVFPHPEFMMETIFGEPGYPLLRRLYGFEALRDPIRVVRLLRRLIKKRDSGIVIMIK